jgi:hypothetical protein
MHGWKPVARGNFHFEVQYLFCKEKITAIAAWKHIDLSINFLFRIQRKNWAWFCFFRKQQSQNIHKACLQYLLRMYHKRTHQLRCMPRGKFRSKLQWLTCREKIIIPNVRVRFFFVLIIPCALLRLWFIAFYLDESWFFRRGGLVMNLFSSFIN